MYSYEKGKGFRNIQSYYNTTMEIIVLVKLCVPKYSFVDI